MDGKHFDIGHNAEKTFFASNILFVHGYQLKALEPLAALYAPRVLRLSPPSTNIL